jgi:hypothetical protein
MNRCVQTFDWLCLYTCVCICIIILIAGKIHYSSEEYELGCLRRFDC